MWNIWTKRVLHCTSEPSIVTNHWALNTTFTHLFLNILKGIQEFKSNNSVTPPKTTFATRTKLDRELFQSRAENLNMTYRAFSHDVTADIKVS